MVKERKARRLNRDLVVAKAIQLIDDAGSVDLVSLKMIAEALKVRTPSLYNHVKGLDDLHAAIRSVALREMLADCQRAIHGKVGREALFEIAHAYRRFAHAHRGIYPLVLSGIPFDPEQTAVSNQTVQLFLLVLASYNGAREEDAMHQVRSFRSAVHGFVSLEAAGGFNFPLGRDKSFDVLVNLLLDGLVRKDENLS